MKAIVYKKYGSPSVLQLKEVDQPVPNDDEVLIKVHAASINSWDWDMLTGRSQMPTHRLPDSNVKKCQDIGYPVD